MFILTRRKLKHAIENAIEQSTLSTLPTEADKLREVGENAEWIAIGTYDLLGVGCPIVQAGLMYEIPYLKRELFTTAFDESFDYKGQKRVWF